MSTMVPSLSFYYVPQQYLFTREICRSVTQSPVRIRQNTVPLNVNPLLGIYVTSFPEVKTATPHPTSFRSRENSSYTYLKNKKEKKGGCATLWLRRWIFQSTEQFVDESRCYRTLSLAEYSSICCKYSFCLWSD